MSDENKRKHNVFNGIWKGIKPHRKHHHYEPFYDEHADYNTNAKSYYDYLARFNYMLWKMQEFINRLLDRNIEFTDTKTIRFLKRGDWVDNGGCEGEHYDDIINVRAHVNISDETETRTLKNTPTKNFTIPNGSKEKNDGVWSPDYLEMLESIDDELGNLDKRVTNNKENIDNIKNDITNIKNDVSNIKGGLQKIIDNLFESGAITSKNINNFTFKNDRDIATGNINLFGGTTDGNSFIKTSDNKTENDITAGY